MLKKFIYLSSKVLLSFETLNFQKQINSKRHTSFKWTILPKPTFHFTVVVSRCWWDPFRMLIWLHLDPSITLVWFYKDPTQILENSLKYPIMFENWSIHDPELIPLTELSKVQDPMGTLFGWFFIMLMIEI